MSVESSTPSQSRPDRSTKTNEGRRRRSSVESSRMTRPLGPCQNGPSDHRLHRPHCRRKVGSHSRARICLYPKPAFSYQINNPNFFRSFSYVSSGVSRLLAYHQTPLPPPHGPPPFAPGLNLRTPGPVASTGGTRRHPVDGSLNGSVNR